MKYYKTEIGRPVPFHSIKRQREGFWCIPYLLYYSTSTLTSYFTPHTHSDVSIRFTELDYRQRENDATGLMPVIVERIALSGSISELASPITIKVIPFQFSENDVPQEVTDELTSTVSNNVQFAKSKWIRK